MNKKGHAATLTNAGKGRPKGVKNRYTNLKDEFLMAFEQIGGSVALTAWARENQGEFYRLLSKMLPSKAEITGEDGGPVQGSITIRFVEAKKQKDNHASQ